MEAAIAECRRRTLEHMALPPGERFTLAFVTGKSWSAYNWYKGNATSLIEVNTDLPVRIGRAVDLGCHEGYPGHHVYNMLLEQKLAKERGWVEYTVYPLYSPQSFIAEGSANYGIDLAFPAEERLRFEAGTLYPVAGLSAADAPRYLALIAATKDLSGARFTIAADYLEGRIDRARAVELTRKYQLVSKARAEQSVAFIEQYRSYVINYGLGEAMVRAWVEAAGPSQEARWRRMETLLSEPTLPRDLGR
jgi:quinol monooxygenase YgiN